jgi:predicted esterase
MSLFRANSEEYFEGPHQTQKVVQAGAALENAKAAMIMIHGRGASAESIVGLANEFDHKGEITFLAPQASGSTWYPYSFMAPTENNQPGINSGLQAIFDIISLIEKAGLKKEQIYILGFSQGACLASEFVARHPDTYGGLIALSGGLIGDTVSVDNFEGSLNETPVFMGCSDIDPHIPKERVNDTAEILSSLGAQVTKKLYQGMAHTVNEDELDHINQMIAS